MSTQFFGHIIDNEEVESISGERSDVWNPWTQEVFAQAAEGGAEDAERAIASARKAFDEGPWPRMTHPERAAAIHKLADLMEERADELATLASDLSARLSALDAGEAAEWMLHCHHMPHLASGMMTTFAVSG